MKRASFLVILWALTHIIHAQLPPGTVQYDSVFIDATEITNIEYLEYLHYLKRDSARSQYLQALPDTTVWFDIYDNPLAKAFSYDYLRKPHFSRFPVVGVTRNQARSYCSWRSHIVNANMNLSYKVTYRLPSPEEWYSVAIQSSSYQISNEIENLNKMKFERNDLLDIKNKSGTQLSLSKLRKNIVSFYERNPILLFENLSTAENFEFKEYLGIGSGPKRSYAGINQVNNIRGNVSELTSEPGLAMGGNWALNFSETPPDATLIYDKSSALLGFRCICDIAKK